MKSETKRQYVFTFEEGEIEGIVSDLNLLNAKQAADRVEPRLSDGSLALVEHFEEHAGPIRVVR